MNETESVVLCEGYHDRAFWAGWLLHLGCSDRGARADGDPWGRPVRGGVYGYHSRTGGFVRVVPCCSEHRPLAALRERLADRSTHAVRNVVLSFDPDVFVPGAAGAPADGRTGFRRQDLSRWLVEQAGEMGVEVGASGVRIGQGAEATTVYVAPWTVDGATGAGVPGKQTLERLVAAAIVAARPERGEAVQAWLDGRPNPPIGDSPKAYAWSYMAGWCAEDGPDYFYRGLWADGNDEQVRQHLERLLRASGAWEVAEALTA